jgi:NADH-quinone oxidoreductase subunit E
MLNAYVDPPELPRLNDIIDRHQGKPGALLGILEAAQETQEHHFLPENVLRHVAERTGTPLAQVYSVATFYSFFQLKPQGDHTVVVCRGTACHTRGSLALLEDSMRTLGLSSANADSEVQTTEDGFLSLRTVACFGQCALAPVVMCDGVIHSSMTGAKMTALLRQLRKGGNHEAH